MGAGASAAATLRGRDPFGPSHQQEQRMSDNVYKIIEIVGSSETSIEDAIDQAVARASTTLHDIRWFEVKETRGHVEHGRVAHYQVTLRIGFTLRD
jgi:flavin-binding protein dodecin